MEETNNQLSEIDLNDSLTKPKASKGSKERSEKQKEAFKLAMQKRADNIALKKAKKVLESVGVMTSQNQELNVGAVSKPKISAKKVVPPIIEESESESDTEILVIKNRNALKKKQQKKNQKKTKTIIFDSSDSSSGSDSDSSSGSSFVQSPKYTKRKNVKIIRQEEKPQQLIKKNIDYNNFFA